VVVLPLAVIRLVSASGSNEPRRVTPTTRLATPSAGLATSIRPATSAPAPSGEPPPCGFGDELTAHARYADWARTLLDGRLSLPSGYEPPDLASIEEAGFEEKNLLVRSFVIPDLRALREAAEDAGRPVDVIASYRSYWHQKDLFERRVEELGPEEARAHTARPGHSEHQLGTTIDFKLPDEDDVDQSFGSTATGRWLGANAYRFGFVESYPEGKTDVTCYTYEPWHFRYVGRERAERIRASGLTLREFLWREAHPSG